MIEYNEYKLICTFASVKLTLPTGPIIDSHQFTHTMHELFGSVQNHRFGWQLKNDISHRNKLESKLFLLTKDIQSKPLVSTKMLKNIMVVLITGDGHVNITEQERILMKITCLKLAKHFNWFFYNHWLYP